MYYVYCLQSLKRKDWLYVGSTADLKKRFNEHQKGKIYSTSRYLPLRLIYYESYLVKKDATQREYELKHNITQITKSDFYFIKQKLFNSFTSILNFKLLK